MLTKVYLEQYKILLGHLGGNVAMLEYQKELLKNIYSSKENYEAAKDLVEIFEYKKDDVLGPLITDRLKEFVEKLGFYFFEYWAAVDTPIGWCSLFDTDNHGVLWAIGWEISSEAH